jgi:hypothetical protein
VRYRKEHDPLKISFKKKFTTMSNINPPLPHENKKKILKKKEEEESMEKKNPQDSIMTPGNFAYSHRQKILIFIKFF